MMRAYVILFFLLSSVGCSSNSVTPQPMTAENNSEEAKDHHSYSNPEQVMVKHIDLDWDVLFDQKVLNGTAVLSLERAASAGSAPLILDTRELKIAKAEASVDGESYGDAKFTLGSADPILGAPLTIELPEKAARVRITYSTSPSASGLQWLEPQQTGGKKHPFMFSQSQAIHARSWIPLQDSPKVRVTYSARVRTPKELLAVMSAENDANTPRDGDYALKMSQPVPSYLIAIAVGDLAFRPLGARTGVYAEQSVIDKAARELEDTEKMVEATEKIYGPYRWGRYDLLILPPSFPFGGMENPRLTFATPTILAGDKSLVSLVAHELAHSWSGNLVTNATWRDFWLNEGFTVYLERRIQEAVYGRAREEMEAVLGRQDLKQEMSTLDEKDEILHVDLKGRDPDEGLTQVAYEKGALFLRHLEETFGREEFDKFVRGYFDHYAFQSITTAQFVDYLKKNLLDKNPQLAAKVPVEEWIYQPGIPASAPLAVSDAFPNVEKQADAWMKGEIRASDLKFSDWSTQERLHFLRHLPEQLDRSKMEELDKAFGLTATGNSEIAHQWLLMSIRSRYEPAYPRLEEYLTAIGRRKLIKPLYDELVKTPEGRERAMAIYRKARPTYHPIAVTTLDEVVKWEKR